VPVSKIAKLKTSLQLIALGILILSESGISVVPIILLGKIALWLAAILTLYTGYDYLKSGFKHL
jgi:phosphatidylglycerophosphate synthase